MHFKDNFNKSSTLMRSSLSLSLKKRIVKELLWITVFYGSEMWTLQKNEVKWSEALMDVDLEKVIKISWTQYETNDEVLEFAEEQRNLVTTVRHRQKNGSDMCCASNGMYTILAILVYRAVD